MRRYIVKWADGVTATVTVKHRWWWPFRWPAHSIVFGSVCWTILPIMSRKHLAHEAYHVVQYREHGWRWVWFERSASEAEAEARSEMPFSWWMPGDSGPDVGPGLMIMLLLLLVGCDVHSVVSLKVGRSQIDSLSSVLCPVFVFPNGAEAVRTHERSVCGQFLGPLAPRASSAQQAVADSTCLVWQHTDTISASIEIPGGFCDTQENVKGVR